MIEATNAAFGTGTMVIPAGSYKNQDADVTTVSLGAMLVATDQMGDEEARALAASLINNIDEVRAVHKSMQALTPELLAKPSVVEFHPGALKAYQDAGLAQ